MKQQPLTAAPSLDAKVQAAKEALGCAWVLHPNYVPNPRHSPFPDRSEPARLGFLEQIREAAARDRQRNLAALNPPRH